MAEFYHFQNLMCLGQEKDNFILGPFSLSTYKIWPVKFIGKINWCTKFISLFKNFKIYGQNVAKKCQKCLGQYFFVFILGYSGMVSQNFGRSYQMFSPYYVPPIYAWLFAV